MTKYMSVIFLDRDGTMNIDNGYVYNIKDFQFINGVIEAMQELKTMGFSLVMVTNQSGLARGFFSKEQFIRLTKWIDYSLENHNIHLDGIYFCPHHPQAKIKALRQKCNCRKPKPGMLLDAQRYLNIDFSSSYIVGDKLNDMLAGKAIGIGTRVLVRSGQAITQSAYASANWIVDSLAALPSKIKQYNNKKHSFLKNYK